MISKFDNIAQNSVSNDKAENKAEKDATLRLSSMKAGEKAKQLLRSIMSDLPADDQFVTHNFD